MRKSLSFAFSIFLLTQLPISSGIIDYLINPSECIACFRDAGSAFFASLKYIYTNCASTEITNYENISGRTYWVARICKDGFFSDDFDTIYKDLTTKGNLALNAFETCSKNDPEPLDDNEKQELKDSTNDFINQRRYCGDKTYLESGFKYFRDLVSGGSPNSQPTDANTPPPNQPNAGQSTTTTDPVAQPSPTPGSTPPTDSKSPPQTPPATSSTPQDCKTPQPQTPPNPDSSTSPTKDPNSPPNQPNQTLDTSSNQPNQTPDTSSNQPNSVTNPAPLQDSKNPPQNQSNSVSSATQNSNLPPNQSNTISLDKSSANRYNTAQYPPVQSNSSPMDANQLGQNSVATDPNMASQPNSAMGMNNGGSNAGTATTSSTSSATNPIDQLLNMPGATSLVSNWASGMFYGGDTSSGYGSTSSGYGSTSPGYNPTSSGGGSTQGPQKY